MKPIAAISFRFTEFNIVYLVSVCVHGKKQLFTIKMIIYCGSYYHVNFCVGLPEKNYIEGNECSLLVQLSTDT